MGLRALWSGGSIVGLLGFDESFGDGMDFEVIGPEFQHTLNALFGGSCAQAEEGAAIQNGGRKRLQIAPCNAVGIAV